MGLESTIEDLCCDDAKAAGWMVKKISFPGSRGALDRMFIKNGRVVFIEFKRPGKLKNTSTGQNDTIKDLIAAGAECHVVDTPLAVYRILGIKR